MDRDRELQELLQYAEQFSTWLAQHEHVWDEVMPHLAVLDQAIREHNVLLWMQAYQSALVLRSVAAQAGFSEMAEVFGRAARRLACWVQASGVGVN